VTEHYTLNQIYEMAGPGEYPVIDKEDRIILIVNRDSETSRVFRIVSEQPLLAEELTVDFQELAEKLARGLDKVELLKEVLRSAPPNDVIEIKERLDAQPDASISSSPGCFSLKIGGRRGRPKELVIRN